MKISNSLQFIIKIMVAFVILNRVCVNHQMTNTTSQMSLIWLHSQLEMSFKNFRHAGRAQMLHIVI